MKLIIKGFIQMSMPHNLKQFLIAVDQLVNVFVSVLFLEKAWADETLSSHCYRWKRDGVRAWAEKIVNAVMFDENHCEESYQSELERQQLPPEMRE